MNRGDQPQSEMTIRERMALEILAAIVGNPQHTLSPELTVMVAVEDVDALIAELAKRLTSAIPDNCPHCHAKVWPCACRSAPPPATTRSCGRCQHELGDHNLAGCLSNGCFCNSFSVTTGVEPKKEA
jgi:hypothetical protein